MTSVIRVTFLFGRESSGVFFCMYAKKFCQNV